MTEFGVFVLSFHRAMNEKQLVKSCHGTDNLFHPTGPYKSLFTGHGVKFGRNLAIWIIKGFALLVFVVSQVLPVSDFSNQVPGLLKWFSEWKIFLGNLQIVHMAHVVIG